MNNIIKTNTEIKNLIYNIRGLQVMLSSDVARLYNVETKVLNQTIKRNINRFPDRFCFQLKSEEMEHICSRSQNVTLNKSNNLRGKNYKYLPYALSEQGIMMLSGLLKSDIAVKVNIQIIDAFVNMRCYFNNNTNEIIINHENRLSIIEETLSNYIGKELLDILKNINKKIIIVTKRINKTLETKYIKQYNNITFIINNSFHDRFIIIDRKKLFACGASFKDLGKKCFAINEINDKFYLNNIIEKVLN